MRYEDVINQRVANVPPSGIRKFFDIVRQMPDAISLGVGEPDFVTPVGHPRRGHSVHRGGAHAVYLQLGPRVPAREDLRVPAHALPCDLQPEG